MSLANLSFLQKPTLDLLDDLGVEVEKVSTNTGKEVINVDFESSVNYAELVSLVRHSPYSGQYMTKGDGIHVYLRKVRVQGTKFPMRVSVKVVLRVDWSSVRVIGAIAETQAVYLYADGDERTFLTYDAALRYGAQSKVVQDAKQKAWALGAQGV